MHFLRRPAYAPADQAPGSNQKYQWEGCDCVHPVSAAVATGNDFLIDMLTGNELEKATQLVWRESFTNSDSEVSARCVHALDMARQFLKVSEWPRL